MAESRRFPYKFNAAMGRDSSNGLTLGTAFLTI